LSALAGPRKQTFADQRRITTTMSQALELEFVLVSSDYTTMTAVSKGIKKFGARFVLVPTAHDARECLGRRKVDGVFVDMEVPGAIGLVESIRKGTSNSKAVIFACGASAKESTLTLNAGANFLLRRPLSEENVTMHLAIAKDLLVREQRRYFRHAVNLPVMLKDGEVELQARMTNLSGGGLAIRSAKPLKHAAVLDFEFELTMGARVSGKGQVAWTNAEGMAGINIETLRGKGKEHLEAWLAAKERAAEKGSGT
jgi:response regulator RpfG family c-di-GMP phosphodiesterase